MVKAIVCIELFLNLKYIDDLTLASNIEIVMYLLMPFSMYEFTVLNNKNDMHYIRYIIYELIKNAER